MEDEKNQLLRKQREIEEDEIETIESEELNSNDRRRKFEEARRILEERKIVEDEEINQDEQEVRKREIEERKRQLEAKKQKLLIQREEEEAEDSYFVEEKKRELDEKRRKLEEKRRKLEEQRGRDELDLDRREREEEIALAEKRRELEEKKRQLELRKQSLREARGEESNAMELERKKREIEDRKRKLEERKRQFEEQKNQEQQEEEEELEKKRRDLEEKKKQLEFRRRQLESSKQQDDYEQQQSMDAKKQELERKKRELEQKRRMIEAEKELDAQRQIEAKRHELEKKKQELEIKRRLLEAAKNEEESQEQRLLDEKKRELERKKREIEEKKRMIEEARKNQEEQELSEKKKSLEEKKRLLEQKRREIEALKAQDDDENDRELEEKKRALERRKKNLEQKRREVDTLRSVEENEEIERKKQDLAEKKRALEIKRKQLEMSKSGEFFGTEEDDLDVKKREIEQKKRMLEQKRRDLEEQKESDLVDQKKRELEEKKRLLEERRRKLAQEREMQEETAPDQDEQDTAAVTGDELAELSKRKRELEDKKKKLIERRKSIETLRSNSEQDLNKRRNELSLRKKQLEERRKMLEEMKQKDVEETPPPPPAPEEEEDEFEVKKRELGERRRLLEEKKKQLEESKAKEQADQVGVMAEQEGIKIRKLELEQRKQQLEDKKKAIEDLRKKQEEQDSQAKREEEEIARKKQELEERKRQLEEKKKQLEQAKLAEQKEAEEEQQIEEKKRELAERRKQLEERKKSLRASQMNVTPDVDEKTMKVEQEEKTQDDLAAELETKRNEVAERKRKLEERKKALEEARQKEEEQNTQYSELEEKKRQIEEKRKMLEEKKKALENLRDKQEKEMLIIDEQQMKLEDKESVADLKVKQMQLEERRKKLLDRKKLLEEKRQKEREEEEKDKQDEDQLAAQKAAIEEKRKKLMERKAQLQAERKQESEPPAEDENELEIKRKEIEEKKRQLAERKKMLEEQRLQESKEQQKELKELEDKEKEMQERQKEYQERMKALEDKSVTRERDDSIALQDLSKKEQEYLKVLSPDELRSLEKKDKKGFFSIFKKKDKDFPSTTGVSREHSDSMSSERRESNASQPERRESFSGELEEDWKEAKSPDGKVYYWNPKTRETRWSKPEKSASSNPERAVNILSEEERKIYAFLTPEERAKLEKELHTTKKSMGYDPEVLKAEKKAEKLRQQELERRKREDEKRKLREDKLKKEEEDRKKKADIKAEQERIKKMEKDLSKSVKNKPKPVYEPKNLSQMSEKERQYLSLLSEEEKLKLGINLDGNLPATSSSIGSDDGKNLSRKPSRRDTKESMYYDEELERKGSVPKYRRPSNFETGSYKQEVSPLLKSSSSPISTAEGSPIHDAARNGNKDQLRAFVKEGISINLLDGDGQTPLHIASGVGNFDLVASLINEISQLVERDEAKRLNVNTQDKNGMTPLHLAAAQYASKAAKSDHLRILEILLQQRDIQPSLVSKDYNTALHYFARANAPGKQDELQIYNRVLSLFLERGLDFNYQNSKGETPLHQASLRGSLEVVKFLLDLRESDLERKQSSSPATSTKEGRLSVKGPLRNLFNAPSSSSASPRDKASLQIVNVNLRDKNGETALHCAAKAGNMEIASLLVGGWIDLTVKSEQGTAKDVALSFNQAKIAQYLDETIKKESQTKIPSNLWRNIAQYLPVSELGRFACVCREFRRVSESDDIWKVKASQLRIMRKGIKHSWKKVLRQELAFLKKYKINEAKFLANVNKIVKVQSLVRRYLAKRKKQKMLKMKQFRNMKVKELIDTERAYVENLKVIVKMFLNPLLHKLSVQNDNNIVTMPQVKSMFSNIEVIYKINTLLYESLESRFETWSNHQKIGDVLVNLSENFRPPYTEYINNFNRALVTYEECKKNSAFDEWIKEREKIKLSLNSLLIMPIQRIPRYLLLLKEIIEHTWADHKDYRDLSIAFEKMETLAKIINESKGAADEKTKLIEIENMLEPAPKLTKVPNRKYVKEAEFIEIINKQRIPVYFFLFTDSIVFCRPQKKRTDPPRFKYLKLEKLYTMSVKEVDESTFELQTATRVHTILHDPTKMKLDSAKEFFAETKQWISKSISTRESGATDETQDVLNELESLPSAAPPEEKIKVYQRVVTALKKKVAEEAKAKEQFQLTKQNLELQVKQATGLLNNETKMRQKADQEIRQLREQLGKSPSAQSFAPSKTIDVDPVDRLALIGLSSDDKQWLCGLSSEDKKAKIDYLRKISNPTLSDKERKKLEKKQAEEAKKTLKKQEKDKKDTKRGSMRFSLSGDRGSTIGRAPSESDIQKKMDTASLIVEAAFQNNKESIKSLLESGLTINGQNMIGQTALHVAAYNGNLDIVSFLLEVGVSKGININLQDENGFTPLHSAVSQLTSKSAKLEQIKVCDLLLQQPSIDVNAITKDANTALHFMSRVNLSGKNEEFKLAFVSFLRQLLEKGVEVNCQNNKGDTPLHHSALEPAIEVLLGLLDARKLSLPVKGRQPSVSSVRVLPPAAIKLLSKNPSEKERTTSSADQLPALKIRVDINMTNDNGETPLHFAVKGGSYEAVVALIEKFVDLQVKSEMGTPKELAAKMKQDKIEKIIDETIKKEQQTKLTAPIWTRIFSFIGSDKELEPIPIVCREFRRASLQLKHKKTLPQVKTKREAITRKASFVAYSRKSVANFEDSPFSAVETFETLKISKTNLEQQVKMAAQFLSEETQRRAVAERKLKELEAEMVTLRDPERFGKLEETIKKQRLAYDNLQQQFVLQVEKISNLEKQIKQYKTDKLEYETKYEERVFFMEQKSKEKKEAIRKELMDEIRQLKTGKSKLEETNKALRDQIKILGDKIQEVRGLPAESTGPPIPPRPKSGGPEPTKETAPTPTKSTGPPTKAQPPGPPSRVAPKKSESALSVSETKGEAVTNPNYIAPTVNNPLQSLTSFAMPGFAPGQLQQIQEQVAKLQRDALKTRYDFWESNTKLVIAIDVPGSGLDSIDIYITRFTVTIGRKLGQFEEKYFANKFKPSQISRYDKTSMYRVVKEQITLPCAIIPNKKQAFFHNGTVFLALEKLGEVGGNISSSDWVSNPNAF